MQKVCILCFVICNLNGRTKPNSKLINSAKIQTQRREIQAKFTVKIKKIQQKLSFINLALKL
ncbi:hypothetical protein [Campylobacter troglodytis]|uniref:hypothetical protein n=1 Tax=Campylobacter troglodytis TaxID=654363 RepID=UPI001157005F|nr:hypothetical protein [Campylobacter troglodytis]